MRSGLQLALGLSALACVDGDPPECFDDEACVAGQRCVSHTCQDDRAEPDSARPPDAGPDGSEAPADAGHGGSGGAGGAAASGGVANPCTGSWSRIGSVCAPPPEPDCEQGGLALPSGACTDAWRCPTGWQLVAEGVGCEPLPREPCPGWQVSPPGGLCPSWPCPQGWRRFPPGEPSGCGPEPVDCGAGTVWLPGHGCSDLSSPCVPFSPAEGGRVFVSTHAPAGGDGSRESPYRTLRDAQLHPGLESVVFTPGRHVVGQALLASDVRYLGTCPERVVLVGSLNKAAPGETTLQGVSIESTGEAGLRINAGSLRLRRVVIRGAGAGLIATGAGTQVDAEELRLEDLTLEGIVVLDGARLDCRRCAVLEASQTGVRLNGGATVTLAQTQIQNVQMVPQATALDPMGQPALGGGLGIHAITSTLMATDLLVRGSHEFGILAEQTAALHLERVTVTDTSPSPAWGLDLEPREGIGIAAVFGAALDLTDAVVDGAHAAGVLLGTPHEETTGVPVSRATINGLTVRSVISNDPGSGVAAGLWSLDRVALDATRVSITDVAGAGVVIAGPESSATLADLRIADPLQAQVDLTAVSVLWGASAILEQVAISGGYEVGLIARDAGTDVSLRDARLQGCGSGTGAAEQGRLVLERVEVRDSGGAAGVDGDYSALWAVEGGRLDLTDVALFGSHHYGVAADRGVVNARRLTVTDVDRSGQGDQPAFALLARSEGTIQLTQGLIAGTHDSALAVLGEGASLTASEVMIASQRPGEVTWGSGAFVEGGSLTLTATTIVEPGYVGVWVQDAQATLRDLSVVGAHTDGLRFGDGVLVVGATSRVTATDVISSGHRRAGLYLDGGAVELTRAASINNRYGVVLHTGVELSGVELLVRANEIGRLECDDECPAIPLMGQ